MANSALHSTNIRARTPWGALAFTTAYLLAASAAAAQSGNGEFVFYIAVMALLLVAVGAVHFRVGFSRGVLWALSIWGLAHMAGGLVRVSEAWPINGEIRVLYSLWLIEGWLKYDHVVHAYGFGVTTMACWQGLEAALGARPADPRAARLRPTFGLVTLVAVAAMGFGALNEVVEFFATLLVPETNVGGYVNTGWDLVANATGATVAAALICLRGGRRLTS